MSATCAMQPRTARVSDAELAALTDARKAGPTVVAIAEELIAARLALSLDEVAMARELVRARAVMRSMGEKLAGIAGELSQF